MRKDEVIEQARRSGQADALADLERAGSVLVAALGKLGVDVGSDDFTDTPARVARSLYEMCSGAAAAGEEVRSLFAGSFPAAGYDQLILARDVQVPSLCPHHLLPVRYRVSVGYLPDAVAGRVIGISKLGRVVELLAARPVLQEQLTVDIARALLDGTGARGVGVVVVGVHSCMWARGFRQAAEVVTSEVTGVLRESAVSRAEFLSLVKG